MGKVKVLIAEDESIVAIDLRSRLESHGYEVVRHVLTGADAIKHAVELKPDIVLMDIHLKDDIDGIEAASRIREKLPIPIIFLTAYADNETLERAKLTDVFGYIIKPYQERELFVNIEIALFKYKMEERLKSSQIRLDTTLKSIGDAVITTDAKGIVDFVNPSAVKILCQESEKLIGKNINDVIPLDEKDNNRLILKKDGMTKLYEIADSQILDDQSNVTGDVYILRDISLRQEYENNLRKAKKEAEEASLLKSDFLANMSHELRTPLNSILGLTELSLEADSEDERREYLTIVKQAGESLLNLINSILDFSKIEAGKMKKEEIPFDLLNVMEDTIERLYIQAHKKNIRLTLFYDKECPMYLVGDSHKLFQILINLIGNSIKFTEGGYIHLDVEPVLKKDNYIHILFKVTDTGKGIPAEKKEHIFDSFTQVDSSSTRIHGGTGLGLAIVKSLVELLEGTIKVESELGKGSVFNFEIPFLLDKSRSRADSFRSFPKLKANLVFSDEFTAQALVENLQHFDIKGIVSTKDNVTKSSLNEENTLYFFDSQSLQKEQRLIKSLDEKQKSSVFVFSEIGEQSYWRNDGYANVLINPVRIFAIQNQILSFLDFRKAELSQAGKKKLIEKVKDGYRILLLEDDINNRLIAEKILVQRGHTVESRDNGKKGLEALRNNEFDLLLVDIQMPDMDGIEFTRTVRKSPGDEWDINVPIIAVTAHAIGGYKEKCEAAGMNGFITKPYTIQDFLDAVESTAEKSKKRELNQGSISDSDILADIEKAIEKKDRDEIERLCTLARRHINVDDEVNENLFRIILAARRGDISKVEQLWQTVMESFRSGRRI